MKLAIKSTQTMEANNKKMFLGLYQMLLADAEVHPKELELLYQIGLEKGGITEQEIQNAIFSPNTFITVESLTDDERIEYLYNLSRIAWADGFIDKDEEELLMEASKRLGFPEDHVKEIAEFLISQAKVNNSIEEVLQTIQNS